MWGVLAIDPIKIETHSLFREFSVCHLYTTVMLFVLSLSKFLMQNMMFKLFEDMQNKKYI